MYFCIDIINNMVNDFMYVICVMKFRFLYIIDDVNIMGIVFNVMNRIDVEI